MIDTIATHFKINRGDIKVNKISIINTKSKVTYLCLIEVHVAYFYLVKNIEFLLSFYINFENEEILEREIKENIILFGVLPYINFMILNDKEPYILYDLDFNKVGQLFKANIKDVLPINSENSYINLENKEIIKIHSLLICLLNIEDLRNYLPSQNNLNELEKGSFKRFKKVIVKIYFFLK